jgi:Domain of unknown function (DUF1905)/Bacteriocin-protection, YdeI or OmpD-Associated
VSRDTHTFRFRTTLRREGPVYLADIPIRISKAFGIRGRIPVVIEVPGAMPVRGTAMPRGGGAHKVFLNGEVRRQAGIQPGKRVTITLRLDRDSREVEPPGDLVQALREADALDDFSRFAVGKRAHIIDWIEEVKSETSRERRIAKAVEVSLAARERRLDRARGRD